MKDSSNAGNLGGGSEMNENTYINRNKLQEGASGANYKPPQSSNKTTGREKYKINLTDMLNQKASLFGGNEKINLEKESKE